MVAIPSEHVNTVSTQADNVCYPTDAFDHPRMRRLKEAGAHSERLAIEPLCVVESCLLHLQ